MLQSLKIGGGACSNAARRRCPAPPSDLPKSSKSIVLVILMKGDYELKRTTGNKGIGHLKMSNGS